MLLNMKWMEWNEMCWIVGCGSNIWSYSKPESVSPLIFASIWTYLKFTVLLFKSIDKNKAYTRFHLYFVLISSQWRSHHKLSRALRWTGMLLWRVNDFDEFIFSILYFIRPMLILRIVTNFSCVQMVHWHLKHARMVCYSMEREVYTIIAIIIGLLIVKHENSIVSIYPRCNIL